MNKHQPVFLRTIKTTALLLALSCNSIAHAGPWIDSGDTRLRHHIQVLADNGIITAPITTWPLMWDSISHDIHKANSATLNSDAFWSLSYVKFAFKQQTRNQSLSGSLTARSDVNPLTDFGNTQREQDESHVQIDWLGDHLALRLSGSYSTDPLDDDKTRLDGSYLAVVLGNWVLSAGAIDRWWGPGWNSSLILSHNARPTPGVAIQRSNSQAFESPWLSWLGTWQFNAFASQLESERAIADPYLIGMRLSLKPAQNWELGLSRTMQWGGEGRPQTVSSFKNLLLGKDNRGSGGIATDGSNEPGNQLAGIDIRYQFSVGASHNATYLQFVGEDEAGGLPSRGIIQLGVESSFIINDTQHRIILEASDSTSENYKTDRYNYTYEHGIYRSGYRYKRRPLAAATDNDSQQLAISGQHYLANGHQFQWSAMHLSLNQDRTNTPTPAGSVYGTGVDTTYLQASYKLPISAHWLAEVGIHKSSQTIIYNNETLDDGGYLALRFNY